MHKIGGKTDFGIIFVPILTMVSNMTIGVDNTPFNTIGWRDIAYRPPSGAAKRQPNMSFVR